jgi:hypothetical protein
MDAHGGAERFSVVAIDSAESCIKMRVSLAVTFPGLVPVESQADIANIVFEDILKVSWASAVLENACFIGSYIRGRQTLMSQYRAKVVEYMFGPRLIHTDAWSRDGGLLQTASRHSRPVDMYGLCGTHIIDNCVVEQTEVCS